MVFFLKCQAQNYAWGKIGTNSEVAQLLHSFNKSFVIADDKPYAELWMGTHPKGPSEILGKKASNQPPVHVLLSEYIESNPDKVLGPQVVKQFGATSDDGKGKLPFLFKVLSIDQALSIQAHPNKTLAQKLHKKDPEHYPDDNHKPEMAIALTPMEALCGFRPSGEIMKNLRSFPEVEKLIGSEICEKFYQISEKCPADDSLQNNTSQLKSALKDCFTAYMESDPTKISQCLDSTLARLKGQHIKGNGNSKIVSADMTETCDLIIKLNKQFPNDIGCLSVLFLNLIHLQPGSAVFLGQDEPHAYIAGDCMECMACSDNVVRAGLTPKFKDISVLCDMLTYDMDPAIKKIIEPCALSNNGVHQQPKLHYEKDLKTYIEGFITEYLPPVKEFAVQKIEINHRDLGVLHLDYGVKDGTFLQVDLPPVSSASILIVIRGNAHYNLPAIPAANKDEVKEILDKSSLHQLRRGAIIFLDAGEDLNLQIALKYEPLEHQTPDHQSLFLAFRAYTPS